MRSLLQSTLFGACLSLAALAGPAHAAEFALTASSSHPPVVPWVAAIKDFVVPEASKRAKALGHEITWTEAYSGTLYNFENTLEGIQEGIGDIGWVGTLFEPSKLPLHNITYATPFAGDDVMNLQNVAEELNDTVPALNEQMRKYNQINLGSQAADGHVVMTKKAIKSLEDMKGLKLYGAGAVTRWLEGTGAIGVSVGLPVAYNGIQTGVADGIVINVTSILPFKLHEVAPHIAITQLGGAIPGALTMNLDTFNKLPPELQEMFKQLGSEYGREVAKRIQGFRVKTLDILEKNPNVTLTTFPVEEQKKWAAGLPDIAGEWIASAETQGLPAREVLNAYMASVRKQGEEPLRDWEK